MLIKMFSDKMKINFVLTVFSLYEVIQLLETERLRAFSRIFGARLEGVP